VDGSDWLLALHLLGATTMISAVVLFTIVIVASRGIDRPSAVLTYFRLTQLGGVLIVVGALAAIVFGIWLALIEDDIGIFDFWVIASIVLWVVAMGAGQRSGAEYDKARDLARELSARGDEPSAELGAALRSSTALGLHVVTTAAVLLILIFMIWKPGH
jgi:hypothetical protein